MKILNIKGPRIDPRAIPLEYNSSSNILQLFSLVLINTIQGLKNLNGDKYLFSKRPYFNHSEGSDMNDLTPGLKKIA